MTIKKVINEIDYDSIREILTELDLNMNLSKSVIVEEREDSDSGYIGQYIDKEIEVKLSIEEIVFNKIFIKKLKERLLKKEDLETLGDFYSALIEQEDKIRFIKYLLEQKKGD